MKNLLLILLFCVFYACSPEDISNENEVTVSEMAEEETDSPADKEVENDDSNSENDSTDDEVEEGVNTTLDANVPPGKNFDLSNWNLNVPIEEADGTSTDITTSSLINGYESEAYFYTGSDGAMVFKNFVEGPKTSTGTDYTRSELREMIYGTRYDNENGLSTKDPQNNWFFSSSDQSVKNEAGAVGGELTATVAINHVTTTGDSGQVGRTIIGQIHASGDEPCRLYYRKLPNNTKGAIYFAHEPLDETGLNEQWYEMIGFRSSSASDPADGIELGEKFSYSIKVVDEMLTVTIIREGKEDVVETVNMVNSGFANDYMYFKAGVYTQNNTGDATDYDEVSFYELKVAH